MALIKISNKVWSVWNIATGAERAEFVKELCQRHPSLVCNTIKDLEACTKPKGIKKGE